MTRKGMISLAEADSQMKSIAQEQSALETEIQSIQNQTAINVAFEDQLAEAKKILFWANEVVNEIEATNDRQKMQLLIERLVPEMQCITHGEGRHKTFELWGRMLVQNSISVERPNSENGIYIQENLDLAQLAADRMYEFAYIFSPLRLKGATGSPGNPIAVV